MSVSGFLFLGRGTEPRVTHRKYGTEANLEGLEAWQIVAAINLAFCVNRSIIKFILLKNTPLTFMQYFSCNRSNTQLV
jgi:hypothetical protein